MARKTLKVLLTGSGSGGHVYPLLSVGQALARQAVTYGVELQLHYMGLYDRFAQVVAVSSLGVRMHPILAGKIRRYLSVENIIDIPKFFIGLVQAWFKMFFVMPDVVFSKGGPGALPVVWAAWFYRIPVIVHESDAVPGLTTLMSAPFSKRIGLSFGATAKFLPAKKTFVSGNPLRTEITGFSMDPAAAKESLGFDASRPLVLILGASQGAQRINEFVSLHLKEILEHAQVLHQTGNNNFFEAQKLSEAALIDVPLSTELRNRYRAVPYLEGVEMSKALAAADVVAGRSGSSTISESAFFGKPAILIPLDGSAQEHQRANAYAYAEAGAAVVIEEKNLNVQIFVHQLSRIVDDAAIRTAMSDAARKFSIPDAADRIALEILRLSRLIP